MNGALSAYNKSRLDNIDFAWNGREFVWNQQFEAFKLGKESPKWRAFQRACYKEGTLSEERIKKLKDAGFMLTYDPTLDLKSSLGKRIKSRAEVDGIAFEVARQKTIEEQIQSARTEADLMLERKKTTARRKPTADDEAIVKSLADKLNNLWLND
jgi:hypothetical protein